METTTNLVSESKYMQGARAMLCKVLDAFSITAKHKLGKDDAVYVKAEIDAILDSMDNTRFFLEGHSGGYYGHERDKNGRLLSAKFMFVTNKKDSMKLKSLQNNTTTKKD